MFAIVVMLMLLTACSRQAEPKAEHQEDPRPELSPLSPWDLIDFFDQFEPTEPCTEEDLKPLEEAARVSPEEAAFWAPQLESLNGDQVARLAIRFAEETDQKAESFDRNLLHLLLVSAQRGSGLGMNEIGASLMYCYQGVQRDDLAAAVWFEKAIEKRETFAMLSLGRLHLEGRLGEQSSNKRGLELLRTCANLGNAECAEVIRKHSGSTTSSE